MTELEIDLNVLHGKVLIEQSEGHREMPRERLTGAEIGASHLELRQITITFQRRGRIPRMRFMPI